MTGYIPGYEIFVNMNDPLEIKNIPVADTTAASLPPGDLLGILPVAVYTCDKDGKITYFNETAARLWGYRPDPGDPLVKYCGCNRISVGGIYIPPEQTPMAIALRTGESFRNIQALIERADGGSFHAIANIDPLFDEQHVITGAINVFSDITPLKKAETEMIRDLGRAAEELRRSDDRYHKMIEEVEDYAIIFLDNDGIILNWNKGAEKIKGYKEAEIVGKSFLEFYLPEDQESGLPNMLLLEAKEHGKALYEGWRKRQDGSIFWGSVVLTALHNDQGEIVGFSKVTRDLTAKKRTEDQMKDYLKQLEFRNKELEQFVYAASHDMKEPLRKIHLYNNYITANTNNILDDKSRDYFGRSVQATQRMTALIEDLLAYSRVATADEGRELIALNSVIDEIAAFNKEDFEQKRVIMDRADLPLIKAIPFQIKQLLSNLIDNAVKYRRPEIPAQVHIGYKLAEGRTVHEAPDPFQKYHKITVKDNGTGFDPAYADKIFEIFQRLPATAAVQGTGVGLAICKKIVQNHNGKIEASSAFGKGAIFSIYLPAD